jgi:hypothetical protein
MFAAAEADLEPILAHWAVEQGAEIVKSGGNLERGQKTGEKPGLMRSQSFTFAAAVERAVRPCAGLLRQIR